MPSPPSRSPSRARSPANGAWPGTVAVVLDAAAWVLDADEPSEVVRAVLMAAVDSVAAVDSEEPSEVCGATALETAAIRREGRQFRLLLPADTAAQLRAAGKASSSLR